MKYVPVVAWFCFLVMFGCRGLGSTDRTRWVLRETEQIKGGQKLRFSGPEGRTREVWQTLSGDVWKQVISKDGQVVSDVGWNANGTKQHETLFEEGKCVQDVTWDAVGNRQRE